MEDGPRRLRLRRAPQARQPDAWGDEADWPPPAPAEWRVLRGLRAVRRLVAVLAWTLLAIPVQAVLILLPGHAKVGFARVYWRVACRLVGVRVRRLGRLARSRTVGRPVVYISNHSSWLDILVLGGRLEACFVAKEEVAAWPVIGTVARLGRTVYVRRRRTEVGRERDDMRARLAAGDNLILFPEGTTSDGSRVLPFRSAFLSIAEAPAGGRPPLVQPVSVVYDRLAGLPAGKASRPLFAWYGDMGIASHFWRLAQNRGLRATVLLHPPLDPAAFESRKALAQAAWNAIADGAATLRQNRPPRPAAPAAAPEGAPAFA